MDILFALLLSFTILVLSVLQGVFVAYPLLVAMAIVTATLMRRGFSLKSLLKMAIAGSKQSIPVWTVLLLIGAVIAIWMAAGTIPAIVYYGIQLISPQYFILSAFLLSSLVSTLIGTSFGTAGTIGLAFMIMAKGSGVPTAMIAGAIIAGAYFGDRCSPMSSAANLIASITQTNLYRNIRNMWTTSFLALFISMLFYGVLSVLNPVQTSHLSFAHDITQTFTINFVVLSPAFVILLLSIFRVEVKLSMLVSIAVAMAIALLYQDQSLLALLQTMCFGFELDTVNPLHTILRGGGVVAMLRVALIVIISTAFVGIFAGTRALDSVQIFLDRLQSQLESRLGIRRERLLSTCMVGIASAAFGCTQTIAILLTRQLVEPKYQGNAQERGKLALDLANTVVVLSPLIPWNIAGLVPATILSSDFSFVPFACYLYLLPLLNLVHPYLPGDRVQLLSREA